MANSSTRPIPVSSPRQARRAHWQTVLEACRRSGLSQAEFCRRRGIPPGTLSCWKHKLARAREHGPRPAAVVADPAFVPVRLTATPSPSTTRPVGGLPAWGELEIVLVDGRQLRARGPVDPQWLGQVVRSLERLGC